MKYLYFLLIYLWIVIVVGLQVTKSYKHFIINKIQETSSFCDSIKACHGNCDISKMVKNSSNKFLLEVSRYNHDNRMPLEHRIFPLCKDGIEQNWKEIHEYSFLI